MKKSKSSFKVFTYIVFVIAFLFSAFIIYGIKNDRSSSDYSSYSTGAEGVKALFILSERMGFTPDRFKKPSMMLLDGATLIAVNPDMHIFNRQTEKKYLRKWLWKGNTLVLIGSDELLQECDPAWFSGPMYDGGSIDKDEGNMSIFKTGKGEIIFLNDPTLYTNKGLKIYTGGIRLINALKRAQNRRVLFNEYYHGISEGGSLLWILAGQVGRLATLQLMLGLIVLMLVKSRRFGGKVPVPENEKRMENENLFALSNIYIKSRAYAAALEEYIANYKEKLSKFLGLHGVVDDSIIRGAVRCNSLFKGKNMEMLLKMSEEYIRDDEKDLKKLIFMVKELEAVRKEIRL